MKITDHIAFVFIDAKAKDNRKAEKCLIIAKDRNEASKLIHEQMDGEWRILNCTNIIGKVEEL